MTAEEVYDKFFSDEEYDLENTPTELYSYRSGWNTALKRASIVIRNDIRPQGEWIIDNWGMYHCNHCMKEKQQLFNNFCSFCGADMRGKEE